MKKTIVKGLIIPGILLIAYSFIRIDIQSDRKVGNQSGQKAGIRVFGKNAYQILDTTDFFIYYRYEQVERIKGKALLKTDKYYFSKEGSSDIMLLTIENLKKAYPDNLAFHYALDAHFRNDEELIAYDNYSKTYKIKYLYKRSLK
jgi:hypothetical protein